MIQPEFSSLDNVRLGDLISDPFVQRAAINDRNEAILAAKRGEFRANDFGVLQIRVSPEGKLWRFDGNHRCLGAEIAGWSPDTRVPCVNHGRISDSEAAKIFLAIDNRNKIISSDRHNNALVAGIEDNLVVQKIMSNHNLSLAVGGASRMREDNAFGAIGTLLKMYRMYGEGPLDKAITVGMATWGRQGVESEPLQALTALFAVYLNLEPETVVAKFQTRCPRGHVSLREQVYMERMKSGRTSVNAHSAVMVEMLNHRRRAENQIPIWPTIQPSPKSISRVAR